jgi:hypothetical protein
MTTPKRFCVVLYPAHYSESGRLGCSIKMGVSYPTLEFTAVTTGDVLIETKRFATAYGEPCTADVTCLDKPKPRGFDRACEGLYYNMKKARLAAAS